MTTDIIRIAIPENGSLVLASSRLIRAVGLPFNPAQAVTQRRPPQGLGRAGDIVRMPPADIQAAVQNGTCDFGIIAPTFETLFMQVVDELVIAPKSQQTEQDTFVLATDLQIADAFLIRNEGALSPAKKLATERLIADFRTVCSLYDRRVTVQRPAPLGKPAAVMELEAV